MPVPMAARLIPKWDSSPPTDERSIAGNMNVAVVATILVAL